MEISRPRPRLRPGRGELSRAARPWAGYAAGPSPFFDWGGQNEKKGREKGALSACWAGRG